MLRENHKITSTNKNHPTITLNDLELKEEERKPRSAWKTGIVVELIKGRDNNARGATVRVSKSSSLITRPICKPYHIEFLRESSNEIVTVNDNTIKERPKRESAIYGNIKRKFKNWGIRSVWLVHKVLSRRPSLIKSFIEETKFYKKTEYKFFVPRVSIIFIIVNSIFNSSRKAISAHAYLFYHYSSIKQKYYSNFLTVVHIVKWWST